jgi:alpha-L-rhamnosidase
MVGSSEEGLDSGRADVWDSGRVPSGDSLNIKYAGPALAASKRYFWRVKTWSAAGKPYSPSAMSWWETGLLKPENWKSRWIGYETPVEDAVRHAGAQWIVNPDALQLARDKSGEQHFAFRETVTVPKPVRRAELFATVHYTVSAWINGASALEPAPLPPWKQMPWKKYVEADVTSHIQEGSNIVAVEVVHYVVDPSGMAAKEAPPLSATLVVEYTDGTIGAFASNTHWKSALHAEEGWQQAGFDDAAWKTAVTWKQAPGPTSEPLGNPWIPDSVKALRHEFEESKPVRSARLYATSLGAYKLFLNGHQVGDEVLAPGWTDYRLRLAYQTYDVTAMVTNGASAIAALLAPGWYSTSLQ